MRARQGFSRADLIAAIVVTVLVAALLVLGVVRGRGESRKDKDGTQLRALHQALIVWPQGNNDDYPIPSRIDRANYVIAAEPANGSNHTSTPRGICAPMSGASARLDP